MHTSSGSCSGAAISWHHRSHRAQCSDIPHRCRVAIQRLAAIGSASAIGVATAYFIVLCTFSLLSSDVILPLGGWKVICEIDCHTWYSVVGTRTTSTLGPEMQQTSAREQFVIVKLKTWFNEQTISPQRGNAPLTLNARKVVLFDETGHACTPSREGEAALARLGNASAPLTQTLRPGESYITDLVFDVPRNAKRLRLFLMENDRETRFVIGHENSFWHKKIYLDLTSAASIPNTTAY